MSVWSLHGSVFSSVLIIQVILALAFGFRTQSFGDEKKLIYGKTNAKHSSTVCQNDSCKKTAQRFLQNMDTSVNPCDDFYKFACGNFIKKATIRSDQKMISPFIVVVDMLDEQLKDIFLRPSKNDPPHMNFARHFFSQCMDEDALDRRGVEPLLSRVESAGGWPVLGNWKGGNWSILQAETLLNEIFVDGNVFFNVEIVQDLTNISHKMFSIGAPTPTIQPEILIQGINHSIVKSYLSYMVDTAVMFGADRQTAKKQLYNVLILDIELAKMTVPQELTRDISSLYNKTTLKQLMADVSWFQWDQLLKMKSKGFFTIAESDDIMVKNLKYLQELKIFLGKYPKKVLANYMMWKTVYPLVTILTKEMVNRYWKWQAVLIGQTERTPRWKDCIASIKSGFPVVISSAYIKRFFNTRTKKIASDMTKLIRQQTRRKILHIDWMMESTRIKAVEKLDKLIEIVAYPDELMDPLEVEKYYEGLNYHKKQLFETLIDIKVWKEEKTLKEFLKPANRSDWSQAPVVVVNAFYSPTANSIYIPAAFLQGSVFNDDLPKYVNFATSGSVLGHEIIHGFDDTGCQYGGEGNLKNWWDVESRNNFNTKKQCLIDQYGNFRDKQTNLTINGIKTQGENIADNGGLNIAYRAYKRWAKTQRAQEPGLPGLEQYTTDQLFFLSFANLWCSKATDEFQNLIIKSDTHAPVEFRINGVSMNSPHFARIFQCKSSDPMNPQKKCAVW